MTPESLQKLIDHYHAVAEAESDMGNQQQAMFYRGKADGVLKVLDTDYPDYGTNYRLVEEEDINENENPKQNFTL